MTTVDVKIQNNSDRCLIMVEADKLQLKKGDYFIWFVTLIVLVVLFCMYERNQPGDVVHVTANGRTETYSLLDKQRITISDSEDKNLSDKSAVAHNILVIDEGQVYMEDADCPDQVCVKHKPISKNKEMIICLPNKVFVEIENSINSEIDN